MNKRKPEFVREKDVSYDAMILQSYSVLTAKNFAERFEYFEARLVLLGQVDPGKPRFVNEAPTVFNSFQWFALIIIASSGFLL